MSTGSVHPDFRIGIGSLLVFLAVVAGFLLGYPFAGALAFLVGCGLLVTGATASRLSDLLATVR